MLDGLQKMHTDNLKRGNWGCKSSQWKCTDLPEEKEIQIETTFKLYFGAIKVQRNYKTQFWWSSG